MVETDSVKEFIGETKIYLRKGDSGKQVRYEFCPNCGTTLRWFVEIVPGRQAFAGGTFDKLDSLKPAAEMYTDAAAPWARLGCELSRPLAPDDAFRNAMIKRTRDVRQ
jgi:hypothetical protein